MSGYDNLSVFLKKNTEKASFLKKNSLFCKLFVRFALFLSYLFNEIEFLLLFSSRNLQISKERGQGERSRRHAALVVCFSLLCRLMSRSLVVWPRATALSGRGSFAFIVLRLCRAPAR